ncbi:hypothetical protein [uncultured Pleomorphomonas sp.]|nr:hypothetical protein [uncultured Pleomorphomonas sp.]
MDIATVFQAEFFELAREFAPGTDVSIYVFVFIDELSFSAKAEDLGKNGGNRRYSAPKPMAPYIHLALF